MLFRSVRGDECMVRVSYLPLQKDLEAEQKDNAAEQERLAGSSLVYGETVQVRVGGGIRGGLGWVIVSEGSGEGEGGDGGCPAARSQCWMARR